MNKTIYIRDADLHIWERSKQIADEGISVLIIELLETWLTQKEFEIRERDREHEAGLKAVLENIDLKKRLAELEKEK